MRLILAVVVIAVAVAVSACASSGAVPRPFPGAALPPTAPPATPEAAPPSPSAPASSLPPAAAPAVVRAAVALRGTPYRNGGSDPAGFDCSGFVQWIFGQQGVRLPREVRDQFRIGNSIDLAQVQPGDLLFFETVSRGASHVGIAIGGGEFIHAPSSRGVVRIERYGTDYWASRFIAARRIGGEIAKTD